jgi:hypothetical protein
MQANARAFEKVLSTADDFRAGSNGRSLSTGEPSASLDVNLSSRELIARQRALVQDTPEVLWLTQNIIDSTREQLDRPDFLSGNFRPGVAHEGFWPLEPGREARLSQAVSRNAWT